MATPGASSKLTYDDYVLIPEDGRRHEIVAGEEYVSPSPRARHQTISWNLAEGIAQHLREHPGSGRAFAAPFDVVLSPGDVVQPDLLFVTQARLGIITEANVQGAPDLAVEIVSEGLRERDEILKRKLYEQRGVAEYWVIDPALASVEVYRAEQGSYARVAELSRETGGALTTPLLPGLAIEMNALFADA